MELLGSHIWSASWSMNLVAMWTNFVMQISQFNWMVYNLAKLNKNFIFEMRKNSAVILITVKAFVAVMYQIPAVNDCWLPITSSAVRMPIKWVNTNSLMTFEWYFLILKHQENCNAMSSFIVLCHVPWNMVYFVL